MNAQIRKNFSINFSFSFVQIPIDSFVYLKKNNKDQGRRDTFIACSIFLSLEESMNYSLIRTPLKESIYVYLSDLLNPIDAPFFFRFTFATILLFFFITFYSVNTHTRLLRNRSIINNSNNYTYYIQKNKTRTFNWTTMKWIKNWTNSLRFFFFLNTLHFHVWRRKKINIIPMMTITQHIQYRDLLRSYFSFFLLFICCVEYKLEFENSIKLTLAKHHWAQLRIDRD